jgi:hypothetical protein
VDGPTDFAAMSPAVFHSLNPESRPDEYKNASTLRLFYQVSILVCCCAAAAAAMGATVHLLLARRRQRPVAARKQLALGWLAHEAEFVANVGIEKLALAEATFHCRIRCGWNLLIRVATA